MPIQTNDYLSAFTEPDMTIADLYAMILRDHPRASREGNHINAPEGTLNLTRLTTLPDGASLTAGGDLYLGSLTTLPDGVTLTAGGCLDLRSLTGEEQVYQGRRIRLRTIDGICTRLIRSRAIGGVTLWSAQYFRGNPDSDTRCHVAQDGDTYAHGNTADEAMRDLRFEMARRNHDPDELRAGIRRRNTVTFNDYRLITGACQSGLTEGLRALGHEGADELPLPLAMELSNGQYGGTTFRRFMEEGQ